MSADLNDTLAAIEAAFGKRQRPADAGTAVEPLRSEMTRHWSGMGLDLPADITWDEWVDLGDGLVQIERNLKWALGDWWLAGEARFGEVAYQAAPMDASGETVRKAAWVCERIPVVRRRTDLTFGHHDAVASLDPAVADALLARAAAEGLSVTKLRNAVRAQRAIPAQSTPAATAAPAAAPAPSPAAAEAAAPVAAGPTPTPDGHCPCCGAKLDVEAP
jgi:hypothetical protein